MYKSSSLYAETYLIFSIVLDFYIKSTIRLAEICKEYLHYIWTLTWEFRD